MYPARRTDLATVDITPGTGAFMQRLLKLSLKGSLVLGLAFVVIIDYNCTQKGIQNA